MLPNLRIGFMGLTDTRLGELYYASRDITDEQHQAVLKVLRSFSGEDQGPGDRLKKHDRYIINLSGEAILSTGWTYDGEMVLSEEYRRTSSGDWKSVNRGTIPVRLAAEIEHRYQVKLSEITVTVAREHESPSQRLRV